MIAIGIVAIPAYARLRRGQVLAVRSRDFIVAARTIGCTPMGIIWRHIFPNIMNTLIVPATLSSAFAILAEAALSFLGLGPQPPYLSWGQDINYSQRYLPNLKWWMSVGPAWRSSPPCSASTTSATRCATPWTPGCGAAGSH